MATREIIQIPDKHTGDINELRDKKVATATDATSATDITSQCEFLLRNGQTGEFMNTLKAYIDESVRSALGALVNNLDKGTSISTVLATDANNDLGSITPSNLASVLGAAGLATKLKYTSNSNYETDFGVITIVWNNTTNSLYFRTPSGARFDITITRHT